MKIASFSALLNYLRFISACLIRLINSTWIYKDENLSEEMNIHILWVQHDFADFSPMHTCQIAYQIQTHYVCPYIECISNLDWAVHPLIMCYKIMGL